MADYRLSAQAISRGKGQSSIASSAYRAGARLIDERTGEIHDYTRKQGVTHSRVYAPEGTPEWMQDRAQLWNAVEAVETRKNSQLAREIQLSLPHELEADQRQALVIDFVQEQFVTHGMIADVAIHAPSAAGDERNHHAHIMLTMRELTSEGFHPKKATEKARSWNSDELLLQWREEWAKHQNRALERHGHSSRVDHRSFEAQGIDREPTQHLGHVASDMERNGKASRIGDENRQTANDNQQRARDHATSAELAAQIAREKFKFGKWAEYKRGEIENAQELADLDLSQKHHRQKSRLEDVLAERNGTAKATIKAEIDTLDRRLNAKGIRRVLRHVFGREKTDMQARQEFEATITNIYQRENEERRSLEIKQDSERRKEARRQSKNRDRLEGGIRTARQRREEGDWKPRSPTRGTTRTTERTGRPDRQKTADTKPEVARSVEEQSQPENKPIEAVSLADLKTKTNRRLESLREESGLRKLWKASHERLRGESSDRGRDRDAPKRTRSPSPNGGKE